jgi:hypothetical protein
MAFTASLSAPGSPSKLACAAGRSSSPPHSMARMTREL